MILATYGDTPYNIVLFLHILAVMVAIAPGFVNPFLDRQMEDIDQHTASTVRSFMASGGRRIHSPALAVAGLLGFGLVGMSGDTFSLSDSWIIVAIVVWIAANGVEHGLLQPALRSYGTGDRAAKSKVDLGGGLLALMMIVLLYLMVFRPGA